MKDKRDEESIVEGAVDELLPGRLKKGYSPKPRIKYGFSIRTLAGEEEEKKKEVGKEKQREILEPIVDVFDEI